VNLYIEESLENFYFSSFSGRLSLKRANASFSFIYQEEIYSLNFLKLILKILLANVVNI